VNFGAESAKNEQVLYQGTALAVPNAHKNNDGL